MRNLDAKNNIQQVSPNKYLMKEEKQATKEEVKEMRRRCFTPNCKKKAWLLDWTGYQHCFGDWYRSMQWGGGNKWFYVKTTRIF